MPRLELHEEKAMSLPDGTSAHKTGKGHTKMSEARMYNPSVASNEMTMSRKMEFVKNDEGVSGPFSLITLSIPLNAR